MKFNAVRSKEAKPQQNLSGAEEPNHNVEHGVKSSDVISNLRLILNDIPTQEKTFEKEYIHNNNFSCRLPNNEIHGI